ncbi:MAG TPA: MoxR family ATPase [Planctomycetota bacterium]|nr:MoxR family ATPase [Planctomycetota bacterium]
MSGSDQQNVEVSALEREKIEKLGETARKIRGELDKKIVGMTDVVDKLLMALFSGGHCLLVGVPGLAKTLLISSLSEILSLKFRRIQFTPDLMPSDITGTEIIAQNAETGERHFQFAPGPIFAHLVLADEINRTPPKTQAALLEAMEEHQVTSAGKRYPLEQPFYVLATQNPIEQEGTYPLAVAQLDRFMFEVRVSYPTFEEEYKIASMTTSGYQAKLEPLISREEILELLQIVRKVEIGEDVLQYATRIARATRAGAKGTPDFVKDWLTWGVGPRGGAFMILAAKSRAMLDGRARATAADVRAVATPVLRHRLIPSYHAEAEGVTPEKIVARLVEAVESPDGKREMAAV